MAYFCYKQGAGVFNSGANYFQKKDRKMTVLTDIYSYGITLF